MEGETFGEHFRSLITMPYELDQQRRRKLYQQEQRPDSACAEIVITEKSLPRSFIYVASEAEFKQHGQTDPTRTYEQ